MPSQEEKMAAVEACWPKWPQVYDVETDTFRDVTQTDVDRFQMVVREYGKLVSAARESSDLLKAEYNREPINA